MLEFLGKIKVYLQLFCKRDWRGINYKLRFYFRQIDLQNVYTDELGLATERANDYADSGGMELEKVLDSLHITPQDAILDMGCGKGGALITLSKYPFRRVTGVEISADLVEIARRNLRKLWIDNVHIACGDAAEFSELDDYNYIYLFNPFPCPVVQKVMDNIKKSLVSSPREIVIIYLNPVCHDVIVNDTPFVKRVEVEHSTLKYYIYSNVC